MDPALADVEFLARSESRVEVLEAIAERPRARHELRELSGASRVTVNLILDDLEDRRWVSNHHNGAYALTPLGSLLAESVAGTIDVLDAIDRLADLEGQIPWDDLAFDPTYLTDAAVTTPSPEDPLAHMRRFDELAAGADTVRMFSNVVACSPASESTEADREFLANVDELVVTANAIGTGLDESELGRWLRSRIEAGEIALYRTDKPATFLLGLFDDTVGIVPVDNDGMPAGLIESGADPVREWGEEVFETLRAGATRIAPGQPVE